MDNVAAAAAAAATAVSDEKPGAYSDGARRYRNQFVHTINGCAGDFFEPEIIILVSSLLERDVVEFVLLTSLIHIAPRPLHDAFVPRLQVRRELLGHRSARDNARSTRDLARNRSITNQRSTPISVRHKGQSTTNSSYTQSRMPHHAHRERERRTARLIYYLPVLIERGRVLRAAVAAVAAGCSCDQY